MIIENDTESYHRLTDHQWPSSAVIHHAKAKSCKNLFFFSKIQTCCNLTRWSKSNIYYIAYIANSCNRFETLAPSCPQRDLNRSTRLCWSLWENVRNNLAPSTHKFPACDAADQLCSQPLDKSLNGFPDTTWWQPMFPMFPMRNVLVSLASTKPHLKKTFQLWQEQDPVVVDVECIEEPSGMFHSLSLFITLLGSALIGSWDTGHQVALTLDAAIQSSAKMRLAWSSTWRAYAWMCKQ